MSDYHSELKKAFKAVHGCTADFVRTVPVRETFRGQTVWEGDVECFKLSGHLKAHVGYAWGVRTDDGKWDVTTVLELPPVESPETAVRAAVAAHIRR